MKKSLFALLKYILAITFLSFVTNQSVCAQQGFVLVTASDTFPTKEQALNAFVKQQGYAETDKSSETSGLAKEKTVCMLVEPPQKSFDDLYYSIEVKITYTFEDGRVDSQTLVEPDKIKIIGNQRRYEREGDELAPSTPTRSFGKVEHKSGLVTRVETGTNKRVVEIQANLSEVYLGKGTEVTKAGKQFTKILGRISDDAGHVIARRLGGSGGPNMDNLFPQLPNVNRGEFLQWENRIVTYVKEKK